MVLRVGVKECCKLQIGALMCVFQHHQAINSESTYLEIVSDSRLRTKFRKTAPHFRCQSQVQIVTCASNQLAIDWGSP